MYLSILLLIDRYVFSVCHYQKLRQQKHFSVCIPEYTVSKFTDYGNCWDKCLHSIIVLAHEHALQSDSTAVSTRLLISLYICQSC